MMMDLAQTEKQNYGEEVQHEAEQKPYDGAAATPSGKHGPDNAEGQAQAETGDYCVQDQITLKEITLNEITHDVPFATCASRIKCRSSPHLV
jgi:hypothetical protein